MRKPLLDNTNTVVNVIEIEPDAIYTPPGDLRLADEDPTAIIGGTWDPATGLYSPPPDPPVTP
jgi:hypothetical protein